MRYDFDDELPDNNDEPDHSPGEETVLNIVAGVIMVGAALFVYYLLFRIAEAMF